MSCPSCQAENEPSAQACTACGATLVVPSTLVVSIDLSPGTLFDSRYEILGPLGRGGMGMVYKARDRTLDEIVAIKVLRPDFAQDPTMAQRFKSEIKLARKVRHRNICAIHDFGEDQGLLYISMEFIEGVDLKRVLRGKGALPAPEAYEVAIQVSEGLQAVHDAGIIHRDLKTPNIMRDARGVARLMDFGVAKRFGAEGTATATGQVIGTPEYMSPEQAQGRPIDFRSDLYALGIVVYEVFTGRVPFRGETPISTILMQLHDAPPLDGPAAVRLPPELKPLLRSLMAKDPSDRYTKASDVAEALRRARSSASPEAGATAVIQAPTLKREGRMGRPWVLWGVLGAGVIVAAGAVVLRRPGAPPSPSVLPAAAPTAAPASLPPLPPSPSPEVASPPPPNRPAGPSPRETVAPVIRPHTAPSPKPSAPGAAAPSAAPPTTLPAPPPTTVAAPAVAEGTGLLQVAVKPWAEVTVDGRLLGQTPMDKIPLSAGVHSVRVQNPGFEVLERKVTIRPGQTERVIVDLTTEGVRKPQ